MYNKIQPFHIFYVKQNRLYVCFFTPLLLDSLFLSTFLPCLLEDDFISGIIFNIQWNIIQNCISNL